MCVVFIVVVVLALLLVCCVLRCLTRCQVTKILYEAIFVKFFFALFAERNPTRSKGSTLFQSKNSFKCQNLRKNIEECVKVLRLHVSCPYICLVKWTLIGRVVLSHEKAETS